MAMKRFAAGVCSAALLCVFASLASADIFRWDNGELIPGTGQSATRLSDAELIHEVHHEIHEAIAR
jgi:hypothetical protein